MNVDKDIYAMRVAEQVDVVRLRFGKRKTADKTLRGRTWIAHGGWTNDAPHEVAVAVDINSVTRRAGVVAAVHSPKPVATGFHYMIAPVGIGAGQHPDVERLHHDLDVESGPGSA